MKNRTLEVIFTRLSVVIDIFMLIMIAITTKEIALSSAHSEDETIKNSFYKSVKYESSKGLLSFTIPKDIPASYRFYLHVSGRIFMGDNNNGMSFHVFDKESINCTWENGKTYTYPLASEGLDFIEMDFGLLDKQMNFLYEYNILILCDGTKILHKE